MSSNISTYEYYRQKKDLLAQCLRLSEEMISGIENWELVPDILSRKEAAVLQLKYLEDTVDPGTKASLSQEMKLELDSTIKLIQDLDQDTIQLIRKEQQYVKGSLKANIAGQKLMQYAQVPDLQNGRRLDYKK